MKLLAFIFEPSSYPFKNILFKCFLHEIEEWVVTNWSNRLVKHQTFTILHRVDFLQGFENIAFSKLLEIFGIHQ